MGLDLIKNLFFFFLLKLTVISLLEKNKRVQTNNISLLNVGCGQTIKSQL